jgi:hypothetical protein
MTYAYYNIGIKSEDKHETGIIISYGSCQYERMAFGMMDALYTFTQIMDCVLLGLGNVACLIYMGDILVFAETVEIHAERLQQVLVYCCV